VSRTYIADIPGGTATVTIQLQGSQTLKEFAVSWVNAAVGKIELSMSSASQIGTAQPDSNVLARVSCSAGANTASITLPIRAPVKAFQNIYIHCTGAGNLGTAVLN
jgi:hypothetical protein